jgi:membrane-associated protease RseP (regulator of RpoE activity)
VTFVTLALAGGFWWEGVASDSDLAGLLSIAVLWEAFTEGLLYATCVALILGSHEMGHYFACRWYGIPATLPFFIPSIPPIGTFGAVIRIRAPIPNRTALFDVAAAGPLAGYVVALPMLIAGVLTAGPAPAPSPESGAQFFLGPPILLVLLQDLLLGDGSIRVNSMFAAGWVGMLVTSLNLFPVGQLDGGHTAYALSHRLHRLLSRGTLVALLVLIVGQIALLGQVPAYLVWFAILLWMRDRHPRLLDESGSIGKGRWLIAGVLLLIFILSFIPLPFYVVEG